MANPATLQPKPFTSENQPPAHKKSRKGIPNRATIIKKWAKVKTKINDPNSGEEIEVTLLDAAAIGQLLSAATGNTAAWRELQDSLHGKLADKQEVEANVTQKIVVEYIDGDE